MVSEEVGRSEAEIPLEGGEAGPSARPKAKGERIKAGKLDCWQRGSKAVLGVGTGLRP